MITQPVDIAWKYPTTDELFAYLDQATCSGKPIKVNGRLMTVLHREEYFVVLREDGGAPETFDIADLASVPDVQADSNEYTQAQIPVA